MADSTVGGLPAAAQLDDTSLLVVEQQGVARKFTGAQFKEFGKSAAYTYVEGAKKHAEDAKVSADNAKASELKAAASASNASASEKKAAASASEAEKSAVASSEYGAKPAIPKDETHTWWIWDAEKQKYVDSGYRSSGNVYYATFDIDPETGILWMFKPDEYKGPDFVLNDDGFLEVSVSG